MSLFAYSGGRKVSRPGWKKISTHGPKTVGKTRVKKGQGNISEREFLRLHFVHFTSGLSDAFDMKPVDQGITERTLDLWLYLMDKEPVEAFMKWLYAALFATITDQPLPPFGGLSSASLVKHFSLSLGTGRLRMYLRAFLRYQQRNFRSSLPLVKARALTAASTLANLKKGSPAPRDAAVKMSEDKHKKALSDKTKIKQVNPFEGPVPDLVIDLKIKNIVHEAFKRKKFVADVGFPSMNAHFDSPKKNFGAATVLAPFCAQHFGSELHSMHYHPCLGVREVRGVKVNPMIDHFLTTDRSYDCRPTFIKEPLKVRPVTAGPSLEYFLCMPLQKFMWRTLKNHPTFQLIAEPCTAELLSNFFQGRLSNIRPGNWLSGDYTAATDNLRQRFSRIAWNEICQVCKVPNWLRRLGSKSLVGHKIHYKDGTVIDQMNGQLMGSPLSFPILCIVNAAICSLACELGNWEFGGVSLSQQPILVNGDDCVMNFDEKQKLWWEQISAQVGMSPSIGKCYYAPDWLQINSRNYLCRGPQNVRVEGPSLFNQPPPMLEVNNVEFIDIPFINFALCSSNKSKGDEARHWSDLGPAARQFVEGFSPKKQEKLMTVFLRRQKPLLAKCPNGISWWLPEFLGGLGLPRTREDIDVTYRQRQFASHCYGRISAGKSPIRLGLSPDLPTWAKLGMQAARQFERPVPNSKAQDPSWREVFSKANYGPFMWAALHETCGENVEEPIDPLLGTKNWYKEWFNSVSTQGVRELEDLFSLTCPEYQLPGGLTDVLSKCTNAVPYGLHTGITAQLDYRAFGIPAPQTKWFDGDLQYEIDHPML